MMNEGSLSLQSLKEDLSKGVMEVRFRKKSTDEVRTMKCTNQPSVVNVDGIRPKNPNSPKPDGMIVTYDLDKEGWRSFYFDSIISVSPLEASNGSM